MSDERQRTFLQTALPYGAIYVLANLFRPAGPRSELSPEIKTDDRIAYHMEEFKALKSEIAELVKSTASYLQYAILASAAVYAWLATAKISKPEEGVHIFFSSHLLEFAAFLPSILSIVFGMLTFGSYKRISEKGDYLAVLEQQFRLSTRLGWQNKRKDASRLVRWSYVLGWSTLIICNLAGGTLLVWTGSK